VRHSVEAGMMSDHIETCGGVPGADEHGRMVARFSSAEQAVSCAIELQARVGVDTPRRLPKPSLSIGVAVSEWDGFDDGSTAATTAAISLAGHARPGEILLSRAAWEALAPGMASAFTVLGAVRLHDFSGYVESLKWNAVEASSRLPGHRKQIRDDLPLLPALPMIGTAIAALTAFTIVVFADVNFLGMPSQASHLGMKDEARVRALAEISAAVPVLTVAYPSPSMNRGSASDAPDRGARTGAADAPTIYPPINAAIRLSEEDTSKSVAVFPGAGVAKRKAEAYAKRKAQAKIEAILKAEAEAKRKAQAKIEATLKAEADANRKAHAEAEAKRKAEADANRKAQAEAEAKRKAEADAKQKVAAEVDAKRKADAKKKAAAANARPSREKQAKTSTRKQRDRPTRAPQQSSDASERLEHAIMGLVAESVDAGVRTRSWEGLTNELLNKEEMDFADEWLE